jgi:hypothetical protein
MVDAFIQYVPVEARLEFGAVIGLNGVDGERQPGGEVVNELDSCFLVQGWVEA